MGEEYSMGENQDRRNLAKTLLGADKKEKRSRGALLAFAWALFNLVGVFERWGTTITDKVSHFCIAMIFLMLGIALSITPRDRKRYLIFIPVLIILCGISFMPELVLPKGSFDEIVLADCGISMEDITQIKTGYGFYERYNIKEPEQIALFVDYFSGGNYMKVGDMSNPPKCKSDEYHRFLQFGAAEKGVYVYLHFLLTEDGESVIGLEFQGKAEGEASYLADYDINLKGMMEAMGLEYSGELIFED